MNFEPVTIITAELPSLDFYSNTERTNDLRLELLNMGRSIVGVKINGLQGFLVTGEDYSDLIKLALSYNQESIVFSDSHRHTCKINCIDPQSSVYLGALLKSNKHVKVSSGEVKITFIENGQQHVFSTEQ